MFFVFQIFILDCVNFLFKCPEIISKLFWEYEEHKIRENVSIPEDVNY